MLAASTTIEMFRCPGERYDITRSVHLARLAAFYDKCGNCPHAPASQKSPGEATDSGIPPAPQHPCHSLFTGEGVRGRYLNDLTRSSAAEIAGAMVSCLWDDIAHSDRMGEPIDRERGAAAGFDSLADAPSPSGTAPESDVGGFPVGEAVTIIERGRPGPSLILAFDERPASPDIATGVGQALRRMGCEVIDIGLATRPCLLHAIRHLQAAGGIHVTGAGCDPGWTGLDFIGAGIVPCSAPGELDRVAARLTRGYSRPSRRSGSQRAFPASVPYAAGLWKHFHALRPLKISFAAPNRTVHDVFSAVFRKLACRLLSVETPTRSRIPGDKADPDVARIARHVRETGTDFGVLIEDDGEQCTILNEQGRIVAPRTMAGLLADVAMAEAPSEAAIVVPSAWNDDRGRHPGTPVFVSDPNREWITRAMQTHCAIFGADACGRYWFAEPDPVCDALLTVVHLLQRLSRSDAPLSQVA